MKKIEEYVQFICKNSRGSRKELEDLKQEMKSHLTQTVQELMTDGRNEQESIELALNRFGEKNQIQTELAQVFKIQKKFGNVVLAVALIFFFVGICCLFVAKITNNDFQKRYNVMNVQYQVIMKAAKTNNLKLLDETVKTIFADDQNNQIAYVALVQLPNDFYLQNPPKSQPLFSGEIQYRYPENIKDVKEFGNNSGGEFLDNNKYFEIGMKQYSNSNRYEVLKIIGVGFLMVYWVLFGIWATVKAYHVKRLQLLWVMMFFALNIVGYLAFLYKINVNNTISEAL
ncbi:permease prefix domain 1-containing protein [Desulfosporosinus sp. PR]|uniref:permease prefix domain 1-containing protein n=1 Tax=Candidatus Desulfosporosinus nitrosoreducens TaxID=3401928 RepID=UPI0027F7B403|nr:permease prefix domain 1-containing protein [Desulfosporosinus sp. PR]MDQ7097010.1 permease prefix domain 1-containing protein [Desulfosporosinus sp. PR]